MEDRPEAQVANKQFCNVAELPIDGRLARIGEECYRQRVALGASRTRELDRRTERLDQAQVCQLGDEAAKTGGW